MYIYIDIHTYRYIHIEIYMYIFIYVKIYGYEYEYTYTYKYIYEYMCVYIYTCIYLMYCLIRCCCCWAGLNHTSSFVDAVRDIFTIYFATHIYVDDVFMTHDGETIVVLLFQSDSTWFSPFFSIHCLFSFIAAHISNVFNRFFLREGRENSHARVEIIVCIHACAYTCFVREWGKVWLLTGTICACTCVCMFACFQECVYMHTCKTCTHIYTRIKHVDTHICDTYVCIDTLGASTQQRCDAYDPFSWDVIYIYALYAQADICIHTLGASIQRRADAYYPFHEMDPAGNLFVCVCVCVCVSVCVCLKRVEDGGACNVCNSAKVMRTPMQKGMPHLECVWGSW